MKRLDQLTTIRFVMVLLVLFYHGDGGIYLALLQKLPIQALIASAPTAVAYLYVLSGFVMALVYFRPEQKMNIAEYWQARLVRIYPLYIISFALMCVYYFEALFQIKPQKIVANLFVLQAWIPSYAQSFNYSSWSMTVEFFFYAIFPFFIIWAAKRSTRMLLWSALGLWGITQAIHFALWGQAEGDLLSILLYFPLIHLSSFILGSVGGIWYLREGQNLPTHAKTIWVVLAGSLILIFGYIILSTNVYPAWPHNLQAMGGWISPFLILFMVALAMDRSWIARFLNHPWLVNLGEASYAIYIFHVPVGWLYERFLHNQFPALAEKIFDITFLPAMIGLGVAIHFWLDIPLRKRFRLFIQNFNLSLYLLDLAVFCLPIFFIIKQKFGSGYDYEVLYRQMERLIFWIAFLGRPIWGLIFGVYHSETLLKSNWWQKTLLSASAGTLTIALVVLIGYKVGWFQNYPRSIFLIDWLVVAAGMLFIRLAYRAWNRFSSQ